MKQIKPTRICIVPRLTGIGGMVSFQNKLVAGLRQRGLEVCFDLRQAPCSTVLVVGGTRDLLGLFQVRRRGAKIIQRLDGMNWLHRRRRTGLRHFIRAEYGNFILTIIRSHLADHIIYQSEFSACWWERARGQAPVPGRVIYNGVDLNTYTPQGSHTRTDRVARLLLVEGSLSGGYELGLETAIALGRKLKTAHSLFPDLVVAGSVSPSVQQRFSTGLDFPVRFAGRLPPEEIPALDRSAHLLYSADINAACPNSVVEALACGLPVLAFDTGALPEMVTGDAGRVVPYGGDPWRLDPPDVAALALGALEIIHNQDRFRTAARARAVSVFSLDEMVDKYLDVLLMGR